MSPFAERYGPWAVVTGAAAGLGAAYASELAGRGVSVALVDRDRGGLDRVAAAVAGPVDVSTHPVDLADLDAVGDLAAELVRREVGLLVSNAAAGDNVSAFLDQDVDVGLTQLAVNCRAPLVLLHALVPPMARRGRGGVVLMSSMSALRGSPLVGTYAATKAWNLVLGETLWDELADVGVDALAVLPGTTDTPGLRASRPHLDGLPVPMTPAEVAREALDHLGSGPSLVPGQPNRDGEALMASMPRADAVALMGKVLRQQYPDAAGGLRPG